MALVWLAGDDAAAAWYVDRTRMLHSNFGQKVPESDLR